MSRCMNWWVEYPARQASGEVMKVDLRHSDDFVAEKNYNVGACVRLHSYRPACCDDE